MTLWVYLEIAPDGPGSVGLVKGEGNVRCPILYDATCRAVAAAFPDVSALDGLVIPESLGRGYRYHADLLILQLRLETVSGLQNIPILVQIDDQERYMSDEFCDRIELTPERIQQIGVYQLAPGEAPSVSEAPQPQPKDVAKYVEWHTNRFVKEGRHGQANRWGPYMFFRVMEQIDPSYATTREAIERRMFEEPYLKRLAGELHDAPITKELLVQLRHERDSFRKSIKFCEGGRKFLVVEDRLDDGWREVYQDVFETAGPDVSVTWATTVQEARSAFSRAFALIVLDVRLDYKDEETASNDGREPTGIKLARWFRKEWSATPILAASASNKAWILAPLLKEGIKEYWVKESPEKGGNLAHAVLNVIDLYRKAREVLEWADRTRPWIEGLSEIAEQVSVTDIRQKSKSLHALLDKSFSPFSRDLDDGLQINIAFLILFSCMNDLRVWCCRVDERDGGKRDWYTVEELGNKLLVSQRPIMEKPFELIGRNGRTDRFPDTEASYQLLKSIGCREGAETFRRMRDVRNALPLTHQLSDGKAGGRERKTAATDKEINEMLWVLQTVVAKRQLARSSTGCIVNIDI